VAEGADWEAFMEHLRAPLPACFRLNPNYPFVDRLVQELEGLVESAERAAAAEAGAEAGAPAEGRKPTMSKLSWVPSGMAYQLGTDRRSIRRTAGLEALHQWMIRHTENGNITRQEAVSMVPPLALDVAPHHRCLDMCAAPGSKTSQLLEVIARSWSNGSSSSSDGSKEEASDRGQADEPTQGLVVANDADTDRYVLMRHLGNNNWCV
jgi:16S rRNA C967 or C1407 C5-methylase (RsmB/RsmF family)